jgi:hypothetical protein
MNRKTVEISTAATFGERYILEVKEKEPRNALKKNKRTSIFKNKSNPTGIAIFRIKSSNNFEENGMPCIFSNNSKRITVSTLHEQYSK